MRVLFFTIWKKGHPALQTRHTTCKRMSTITSSHSDSDSDSSSDPDYEPSMDYEDYEDYESESDNSDSETIASESERSADSDDDSMRDFIIEDGDDVPSDSTDSESDDEEEEAYETPTVMMRAIGRSYRIGGMRVTAASAIPCMSKMLLRAPIHARTTRKRPRCADMNYTEEESAYFESASPEFQDSILAQEQAMEKRLPLHAQPLRFQLLQSSMDPVTKRMLLTKLTNLQKMHDGAGEYHKLNAWLHAAMRIPLGVRMPLPVKRDAGVPAVRDFLESSRASLDGAVYGHRESKEHIMRILAQWISNPSSRGHCIGIQGPMGAGKSSLVKQGIAKALNLPFAYVALGGAADGAFLEGHGLTYEGSTYGKIAEVLMKTKAMNPVIFFDELDKISDTAKGEELTNILVHLTDATQNEHFNDRYFTEIDLDLSKALLVFAFNDETRVNPILLDRMTVIRVQGYNTSDKLSIARKHLLPSLLEQYNIDAGKLVFSDDILRTIIERVPEEKGVRNLRRGLESITSWYNMLQYLPDAEFDTSVAFTVCDAFVRKYLKKQSAASTPPMSMYV